MVTIIPAFFHLAVGLIMRRYLISNEYYNKIASDLKLAETR